LLANGPDKRINERDFDILRKKAALAAMTKEARGKPRAYLANLFSFSILQGRAPALFAFF